MKNKFSDLRKGFETLQIKLRKKKISCMSFPDVTDEGKKLVSPSFFPYGTGFYPQSNLKERDVMVLGQDFGTKKYYCDNIGKNEEDKKTLSGFSEILKLSFKQNEVEAIRRRCFFTNCFIGLRNKGPMKGYLKTYFKNEKCQNKWKTYNDENSCFLKNQIDISEIKKIIVLGKAPAVFVSDTFHIAGVKSKSIKELISYSPIPIDGYKFYIIPHPCMWNSNKNHYNDGKLEKMLKEVFS